jgi:hypothetical protein
MTMIKTFALFALGAALLVGATPSFAGTFPNAASMNAAFPNAAAMNAARPTGDAMPLQVRMDQVVNDVRVIGITLPPAR